jgi:hypothetical protein
VRKALNENPMVQLGVLAVGGIVLAVLLMSSLSGGGSDGNAPAGTEAAVSPSAEADAAASSSAAPATTTTPAPAPAPSAGAAPDSATVPAADAGSADGLLPSAGLPEDVLVAYAKNEAIALLVIDPKAISDEQLADYAGVLRARDDVAYFQVKTKDIADYARITQGVAVSRAPALVVIRPRDKTEGAPTAVVSEGFRGPDSVRTALEDALYDGRSVPSYPE